jgi:hypothetical protein
MIRQPEMSALAWALVGLSAAIIVAWIAAMYSVQRELMARARMDARAVARARIEDAEPVVKVME